MSNRESDRVKAKHTQVIRKRIDQAVIFSRKFTLLPFWILNLFCTNPKVFVCDIGEGGGLNPPSLVQPLKGARRLIFSMMIFYSCGFSRSNYKKWP